VTEVHPLSVIEAMASGLPVLGIQSPGVGDTVKDGVTGFIVPDQDLAAYTAKMIRMITDEANRKEMGHNAAREVEKYAIEQTSKLMVERYQAVIDQARTKKPGFRTRWIRMVDKWLN